MALVRGLVAIAFPQGTVHEAREDLQAAVQSNPKVLILWESLTALGRNEFICWVDDAKQPTTRQRRIERTCAELLEGKRRRRSCHRARNYRHSRLFAGVPLRGELALRRITAGGALGRGADPVRVSHWPLWGGAGRRRTRPVGAMTCRLKAELRLAAPMLLRSCTQQA